MILCRNGTLPPGTTSEQLLTAKQIYESSFHPDTGQKQNVFGRMCFQVPGGMAITGAMLSFYKYPLSEIISHEYRIILNLVVLLELYQLWFFGNGLISRSML